MEKQKINNKIKAFVENKYFIYFIFLFLLASIFFVISKINYYIDERTNELKNEEIDNKKYIYLSLINKQIIEQSKNEDIYIILPENTSFLTDNWIRNDYKLTKEKSLKIKSVFYDFLKDDKKISEKEFYFFAKQIALFHDEYILKKNNKIKEGIKQELINK
jgi:hypothetical protein